MQEELGIPVEIGNEVKLDYSFCGENRSDTFRLCGYEQGDELAPARQGYFSKEYVEELLVSITAYLAMNYMYQKSSVEELRECCE